MPVFRTGDRDSNSLCIITGLWCNGLALVVWNYPTPVRLRLDPFKMNITIAIPQGKECKNRIEQELATARNIKSRQTRISVTTGLKKIIESYGTGKAFLWNGNKLDVFDYPLKEFIYHCGKDFVAPKIPSESTYLLIDMDANHCTLGLLKGKRISVLEDKDSNVPRKQDAGGQSQRRFEREREHCKVIWMKKIADKVKEIYYAPVTQRN